MLHRARLVPLVSGLGMSLMLACNSASDGAFADVTSPRHQRKVELETAAKVGRFHNRGLRMVNDDLLRYVKTGKKTKADILTFAAASCTRFLRAEGMSGQCEFKQTKSGLSAQINLPTGSIALRAELSVLAQDYMQQIELIGSYATSAAEFSASVAPIVDNALVTLSGDDLVAVLGVAAVSDSSATYWEGDGVIWAEDVYNASLNDGLLTNTAWFSQNLLFENLSVSAGRFSWRAVVTGDVAGAIAGAFTGGPGGIAPGALAGSVYEAVVQILNLI